MFDVVSFFQIVLSHWAFFFFFRRWLDYICLFGFSVTQITMLNLATNIRQHAFDEGQLHFSIGIGNMPVVDAEQEYSLIELPSILTSLY